MNIFICKTVFQLYFSEQLIKRKSIKNAIIYYLAYKNDLSIREKAAMHSIDTEIVIIDLCATGRISRFIKERKALQLILRHSHKIKNIYISSIESLFIWTVVSKFPKSKLYSFDDGTANYNPQSTYYIEPASPSKVILLAYQILGNKIKSLKQLKSKIIMHFSNIKLPNIIESTEYFPLFTAPPSKSNHKKPLQRVYLGTVFCEVYIDENNARRLFLAKIKDNDILIPHPRDIYNWDRYSQLIPENIINTELFISSLLEKYEIIEVYGIVSSAQFNLAHIPNIKLYQLSLGEYLQHKKKSMSVLEDLLSKELLIKG